MAPERISGQDYSYESDIWALGCTLWECSAGQYPYGTPPAHDHPPKKSAAGSSLLPEEAKGGGTLSFWDLLHAIVECDPPALAADRFSSELCELVASCMHQDGTRRPSAQTLLSHAWVHGAGELASIADWLVPDGVED